MGAAEALRCAERIHKFFDFVREKKNNEFNVKVSKMKLKRRLCKVEYNGIYKKWSE